MYFESDRLFALKNIQANITIKKTNRILINFDLLRRNPERGEVEQSLLVPSKFYEDGGEVRSWGGDLNPPCLELLGSETSRNGYRNPPANAAFAAAKA